MALPVYIQDPATGQRLAVSEDGILVVSSVLASAGSVPAHVLTRQKQYREFLENSSGSRDLDVDGSVSPIDFTVKAELGKVKSITACRMILNGAQLEMDSQDFRRFGLCTSGGAALANGVRFFVTQGGIETDIFITPIVRMGDFLDYADEMVNIKNSIGSQEDFLMFKFQFDQPVVLPPGSTDSITVRIRDNITALDYFRVLVRGYQEVVD